MADFQSPTDLKHNRGLIEDPEAFASDADAASWLYLCGEQFAGPQPPGAPDIWSSGE